MKLLLDQNWLNLGNVPNTVVRGKLMAQAEEIRHFLVAANEEVLEIE